MGLWQTSSEAQASNGRCGSPDGYLVAEYLSGLFIAALVWLWGVRPEAPRKPEDRLATGRAVVAASLALAVGQILIRLVPRPRPFATHAVRLLIERSADPSFPSDHALAAFAIGTTVTATRPGVGAGLLAAGLLLGVARVFVGTHYPSDVLGGAILGAAVGGWSRSPPAPATPFGAGPPVTVTFRPIRAVTQVPAEARALPSLERPHLGPRSIVPTSNRNVAQDLRDRRLLYMEGGFRYGEAAGKSENLILVGNEASRGAG